MWTAATRLVVLLLAAVVSLRVPGGASINPLPRIALPTSERFVGGLMGVSADVSLCLESQHAVIKLSGIPLGGRLEGTARFANGEGSGVVVDEPLRSALRRRFVSIVSARFDRKHDRVYVTVQLPLMLGTQTIMLGRATQRDAANPSIDCTPPSAS